MFFIIFIKWKSAIQIFFECLFRKGDIVFNDARLLDRPLLDCKVDIKPILVFHNAHKVDGEVKNSYKYALNNSDKVAKYYLLTHSQKEIYKKNLI